MRKTFFLLLLVLAPLTSCLRGVDVFKDEKIYYKFTQEDYKFIPQKYKQQNDLHHFISNTGQTITLKNNGYTFIEEEIPVPQSLTQIAYWDRIKFNLEWITITATTNCKIINCKISKTINDKTLYNYTFFTEENNECKSTEIPFYISSLNLTQMQVGGITYNYVTIFDLKNYYMKVSDSSTINKVYYDLEKGFIGFENTKTKEQYWTN